MPNFPPLDRSVQWKISTGAIRFAEAGYRETVEAILSAGLATEVVGLISAGKEADVYLARLHGAPIVVKAYRLYRTSRRGGGSIKVDNMAWRAAFEFEMLHRAWRGGAAVPTPAKRVENLLAMRYLGGSEGPAPRLADLKPLRPRELLEEILAATRALLLAGVVHGDLSAYNILIHEDRPWFIDLSDSVRVDRLGSSAWQRLQVARQTLARDLASLRSYFARFRSDFDPAPIVDSWMQDLVERRELTRARRRPPTPGGTPAGTRVLP